MDCPQWQHSETTHGERHRPVPVLRGHPLVGAAVSLVRDPLGTYERAQREAGDLARVPLGHPPLGVSLYTVTSPEGAQHVLASRSRAL